MIVIRVAPAPGFPSLPHRSRLVWPDEHPGRGVEGVAARHHLPTAQRADKIDGDAVEQSGVRYGVAEDPQPRHPAIRKDRQAHVSEAMRLGGGKGVVLVAPQARAGDDLDPVGVRVVELLRSRIAFSPARLDPAEFRVVAGEEARVDVDRRDRPRRAEPDERPVMSRLAAAPGLPAVDNLAAVAVVPWLESRRTSVEQVLL